VEKSPVQLGATNKRVRTYYHSKGGAGTESGKGKSVLVRLGQRNVCECRGIGAKNGNGKRGRDGLRNSSWATYTLGMGNGGGEDGEGREEEVVETRGGVS